ncbi:MAG: CBS domain-containing protein [Acidimicrobiia bacterium]|nr:MAG: CBS domain-containing protein [Acidimicrobiia bacterium]
MQVRELVQGTPAGCAPSTTVSQAAQMMVDLGIGSLAVYKDGTMVGILTERDIVRAAADTGETDAEPVERWMTPDPDTIDVEVKVDDAAGWMLAVGYRHLPITRTGELVGIASMKDVLWGVMEEYT